MPDFFTRALSGRMISVPNLGALRGRLIAVFGLILVLTAASTASWSIQLNNLERTEATMSEQAYPYDRDLATAAVNAKAAANDERGYLLAGDQQFAEEINEVRVPALRSALDRAERIYPADSLEASNIVLIRDGFETWLSAVDADFAQYTNDPEAAKRSALGVNRSLRKQYETSFENAADLSRRNVAEADAAFASQLRTTRALGLGTAVGSVLTFLLLAMWIVHTMFVQQRRVTERIEAEIMSSTFSHQLGDAMEMAETEEAVYAVVRTALEVALPRSPSELMLADSSEAHLSVVLEDASGCAPLCSVSTVWGCPAIRRGRTQVTESSASLDACPKLRENYAEPCSAVCAPVMFMGRPLGVLHSSAPVAQPWDDQQVDRIKGISGAAGNRLGMLRALEQTKRQAATDPLTGIANRRILEDHVGGLIRNRTSFILAIGDLDNFKKINDTFGHDTGDRALRRFARVLRECTRAEDLVARYGGDEFVVVFPNLGETDAVAVLERVREGLALEAANSQQPSFTASFGVCGTDDASSFDETLSAADRALLAAKRAGRNRVYTVAQSLLEEPLDTSPSV